MSTRRLVLAVACAMTLGGLAAIPAIASAWAAPENFITFSAPVSLPGVTLAAGTYLFRSPTGMSGNVVQVLRRDQNRPMTSYFMGMTQLVERTTLERGSLVSLGEVVPGQPTPIKAWFPNGERVGHEFIYKR